MSDIKKAIMRRVYFLWLARKFVNPLSIKAFVVAILAWQLTAYVSIKNVLSNAPFIQGDFSASFSFFQSALVNTEFISIILAIVISLTAFFILRDLFAHKRILMRA